MASRAAVAAVAAADAGGRMTSALLDLASV